MSGDDRPQGRFLTSRIFNLEQQEFIRRTYVDISQKELHRLVNKHFGTAFTLSQVSSFIHNRHINSGRTGHFEKGAAPWTKGTKGVVKPNSGNFQKGNLPHNHRPLYSERVCSKSGLLLISVPEPNPYTGFPSHYKHKHVWVWEQANGPRPKGHAVIFIDGNDRNFELANLTCVTRGELLVLNTHGYKSKPAELFPSLLALARLELKAKIRTRPGRGRQ